MHIKPGDILDNKYRIERVLGFGGMGFVVRATNLGTQRPVAVKLLRLKDSTSDAHAERLLREARVLALVGTEHVPKVLDVSDSNSTVPYMVMEYLEGHTLAFLLERDGPMPPSLVALYVSQACSALAKAHAAGFIHRDIKPSNLFLTQRSDGSPCIKVLDFGVARLMLPADRSDGNAPRPDHLSDIWSLGVVLYVLATGRLPFQGSGVALLLKLAKSEGPVRPSAIREGIPPEFDDVVLRCLQREREHRIQSADALAAALAPLLPGARS